MSDPDNPRSKGFDHVNRGFGIGCLLHLFQLAIIPLIIVVTPILYRPQSRGEFAELSSLALALGAWSVTQFLYLGPAAWIFFRRGEKETAKGILIPAALGVLLNGSCDALLFHS
jgi:cbb3-type cytochrome oxidase subunit 3